MCRSGTRWQSRSWDWVPGTAAFAVTTASLLILPEPSPAGLRQVFGDAVRFLTCTVTECE